MEFQNLSVLALFFLALVGINGSKSGEEYWKSVWPNTTMPKALSDLLPSDIETSMPIKSHEENQYWTIFFEHDLYPGKKMNLGIQKPSESSEYDKKETSKASHPFGFWAWSRKETEKENQPFGFWAWSRKETEKENQPFGFWIWQRKESEKENQPFGFWIWQRKETEKENQPFGFWIWQRKETEKKNQPFGFWAWSKKESEEQNQPFGFWAWSRKESEKENQPFGFWAWSRKANQPFVRDTQKESQHSVALTSDEKEAHMINEYCRNPSAIGEDKYCALSLESMVDFVISKLGKNIKVMSSSLGQNQENYVVEEVNKIGDKAVMCHRLNFKKVVFYCHEVNATTTYMVPLVAPDGTKSKALTICHHDTRGMNANMLKEVLNVKPGTVPVCHFIGNKAIAWVPDMSEPSDHPCAI
ncbi:unknown seed protein USP-like [Vicia villosa]|uniref:unknown seed protein USP-like n=1 Tax=Vicia villosa TaxID=3911 RepID=UPI00273BD186|nr:unknown seed protein USP-like [Vicia villosa]